MSPSSVNGPPAANAGRLLIHFHLWSFLNAAGLVSFWRQSEQHDCFFLHINLSVLIMSQITQILFTSPLVCHLIAILWNLALILFKTRI